MFTNTKRTARERLPLSLLLLGSLLVGLIPAARAADVASDSPPVIGRLQTLGWDGVNTGQTDNTPLDGTILCAAFGGPDDIAPPSFFANEFLFDNVLNQYRPRTVDVAVTCGAINPTDRDQNWIYAFMIVNDQGGDDGVSGVAAINNINFSLPPCTSGIDNAFPDKLNTIPGLYVTEFGATDINNNDLINFFAISVQQVGIGRQFSLVYGPQVIQVGQSSQIFYYYSPFGPSNRNVSINGGEGGSGQALAHATIPQVVTAQFYPFFECQSLIADVSPQNGTVVPVSASITNTNRSLDPINVNPNLVGNVLLIENPIMGQMPIPQHEKVMLSLASAQETAGCIEFRLTANGPPIAGPLTTTLDIDKDTKQNFNFFVAIRPDFFDNCTSPITITNSLTALTPYNVDPPFEGHTKFGQPTNPSLDTDVNGDACTVQLDLPEISIEKRVQFLDQTIPGNPVAIPPIPVEQVMAPPCGCVKFTLTVTADPNNVEDLTNFTFTDKLPAGLMFMGVLSSSPAGIIGTENPPDSGCITFSNIPDLPAGQSIEVCFKACVRPGTNPGILTNTTSVMAIGANSGFPTSNPSDDASVDVVPLGLALNGLGVNDDIICPNQTAVFSFEACNTGQWPLEVTIPMVLLDSQLSLVSQVPMAGTVVTLDPNSCQMIQITAMALGGGSPSQIENCVRLNNVVGHPDRVDPNETRCDIAQSLFQCIDVIDPSLTAECLSVVPNTAMPGESVQMTKRVTNTGNVALSTVLLNCTSNPDLTPSGIPTVVGPISPGGFVDIPFDVMVNNDALPTMAACVNCTYVGHPANLPPGDLSCDRVAESECCLEITFPPPVVMIDKRVQFLDLTDPLNPVAIPPMPVDQIQSPPCGCVKFTITVTADSNNIESLTNFTFTDLLPPGMSFMGMVQSPNGITAVEGPPGTLTFMNVPDLAAGQSASVCFKACVDPGTGVGPQINSSTVQAVGATSTIPTNMPSDTATVLVVPIDLSFDPLAVGDPIICPDQQTTLTFQVCNTGQFPLEVTIPAAVGDTELQVINQTPNPGTVVLLNPTDCQVIEVTVQALSGGAANNLQNCVTLNNAVAHPDRVDPNDIRCDITRSTSNCLDVIDPDISAVCLSVEPIDPEPGAPVRMTKRVTNTGNVTLDTVTLNCTVDPLLAVNPPIPNQIGPLAPGQSIDVVIDATVAGNAKPQTEVCIDCNYNAHPTVLPPGDTSCNRVTSSQCCATIGFPQPLVQINKQVQFLDLTNPGNPIALPPIPVKQVDSPPCGCVRFTITVTADENNCEDLTNFTFADILPPGLMFMNMVASTPPGINAVEGPVGTLTFSGVPNLSPGQSAVVSFKACVRPGTTPALLTNTTNVHAVGVLSGRPTNNPADIARVNVVPLALTFEADGVSLPVICPDQQSTFSFEVCNTGNWPLQVRVPNAAADSLLNIISQNPPAGSIISLGPANCATIQVTAQALPGGAPKAFENCVQLNNLVAHPDQVDPNDRRCDLTDAADQCVDVIDPDVSAVCFLRDPTEVRPGETTRIVKRITNTGNVTLDTVAVNCQIDPLLSVNPTDIPSSVGPIAPGAFVDIDFIATVSADAVPLKILCINCDYTAHPAALPPGNTSCNRAASSECCIEVAFPPPVVLIDKTVQFLDLTDPQNPVALPPTPVDQVDSPICGCVRFNITVTADPGNFEDLTTFTLTDAIPLGMSFMNMVMSTPPGIIAVEGPPRTLTFSGIPDLAPGASITVSFKACVDPTTGPGLLTNTATVQAVGATSGLPSNMPSDDARVNVVPIDASFVADGADNPIICPDQLSTLSFEVCNTGQWPLEITIPVAQVDAQISLISQNPTAGTVITLDPTNCATIEVQVQALPGGAIDDFQNCVRLNGLVAHPDRVDPNDERCDSSLDAENCIDVIDPSISAECVSVDPDPTMPGEQAQMVKRITNTGNVALDTIGISCLLDPMLSVTPNDIPTTLGPLAPGESVDFDFTVTVAAEAIPNTELCVDCTYDAHPANLPAGNTSCNEDATSECCLTVGFPPPVVDIEKQVQFVDLTDPFNPILQPGAPTEQVDSPNCGCVKFTITVTADAGNFEDLTNFVLTDKLPAGVSFQGNVESTPPGVIGTENPPGSGCLSFTGIPDLSAGESVVICFRACVDPNTPPGVLINTATVVAEGMISELPTNQPSDDASVNVVPLDIEVTGDGATDDLICPPQTSVVSFQICNTGSWPLEVTIPAASPSFQLVIQNQNPAPGTVVELGIGACTNVDVTVVAQGGGVQISQCINLNDVTGHPDQVNPNDDRCDVADSGEQCIDVIDPDLFVECRSVAPSSGSPGDLVSITKRVTNLGNVALSTIDVQCTLTLGLDVPMGSIPSDLGPLQPGEFAEFNVIATIGAGTNPGDLLCLNCDYVAHPALLPPSDTSCDDEESSQCCVSVEVGRIPTLSEWALIVMGLLFGGLVVRSRRS